jgi:hypothetical protein
MELSRRGFLVGAAATPLLAVLPRVAWAADQPLRHLTAHQAAVVEAATARLIPGPTDDLLEVGHPGAREAGVVRYVDALLAAFETDPPLLYAGGPFSDRAGAERNDFTTFAPLSPVQERYWRAEVADLQARYAAGVAALDAAAGGDFGTVNPLTQDQVLTADATGFRDLLFDHAIEGWLAAPEYGGNEERRGWTEVRFRGDVQPTGFPDAQVSSGDGLDVIDPTGIVGTLVTHLTEMLDG